MKRNLTRKKERREQAADRQAARDKFHPQQQLDHLDRLFGKDKGAQKERAKLKRALTVRKKNPRKTGKKSYNTP